MLNDIDLPTEPLRQLYTMTAYMTDEEYVALRDFCEEQNIPLEFVERLMIQKRRIEQCPTL